MSLGEKIGNITVGLVFLGFAISVPYLAVTVLAVIMATTILNRW